MEMASHNREVEEAIFSNAEARRLILATTPLSTTLSSSVYMRYSFSDFSSSVATTAASFVEVAGNIFFGDLERLYRESHTTKSRAPTHGAELIERN
jgi:hypothetical protein